MKRKDIRKILKKWIDEKKTDYNHLWYVFVDVEIGKTRMSREFESLVDEVCNIQRKEEI